MVPWRRPAPAPQNNVGHTHKALGPLSNNRENLIILRSGLSPLASYKMFASRYGGLPSRPYV